MTDKVDKYEVIEYVSDGTTCVGEFDTYEAADTLQTELYEAGRSSQIVHVYTVLRREPVGFRLGKR